MVDWLGIILCSLAKQRIVVELESSNTFLKYLCSFQTRSFFYEVLLSIFFLLNALTNAIRILNKVFLFVHK